MNLFRPNRLVLHEKSSEAGEFWRNVPMEQEGCGVGFVVTKEPTKKAVELALAGLCGMKDRTGEAFGAGDGAGIIMEAKSAREYWKRFLPAERNNVPEKTPISVGMIYFAPELGPHPKQKMSQVRRALIEHGIYVHGWRRVSEDNSVLPGHVRDKASTKWQILYSPGSVLKSKAAYNRMLLYAERQIHREVKGAYVTSLNHGTVTYKAMSTPGQFKQIFAEDLNDPGFISKQVGFHARMRSAGETDDRIAQPFSRIWINGQNTADGAQSSAQADLERRIGVTAIGEDSVTVPPWMSDTGREDGMMGVLMHYGVQARGAVRRRMLPAMDDRLRQTAKVQRYHQDVWRTQGALASRQGPGTVGAMTSKRVAWAMDPLGLRTGWVYGNDELVVGCSEIGAVPIPIHELDFVYQMGGGELAEVRDGKFVLPSEAEKLMAEANPIEILGDARLFDLNRHPYEIVGTEGALEKIEKEKVIKLWNQAGGDQYSLEVLRHMVAYGKEPVEGMGDVRPLAVLSPARLRLAAYFSQIVGVVFDPPMDSLREGASIDLRVTLGRDPKQMYPDNPNEFEATTEFVVDSPFLNPKQYDELINGRNLENGDKPKHVVFDTTFEGESGEDMERKLDEIIEQVIEQAENGEAPILIFDDSRCKEEDRLFVPPAMIATACNYELRQRGLRDNVKLVFSTMDAIEAHDMALLISQGGDAVYAYNLWEAVMNDAIEYKKGDKYLKDADKGKMGEISLKERMANVQYALDETLKEIMSKQGLSTIAGYRGLCQFEMLGISKKISRKYFKYNSSRLGGIDFDDIVEDQLERLREKGDGFRKVREPSARLGKVMVQLNKFLLSQGDKDYSPEDIYKLLAEFIETKRGAIFLRDLLEFVWADGREGVVELSLDDVESVASIICRHFRGSHMSDGALGPVAHAAIALAFNELADELMGMLGGSKDDDKGYSERLDTRPKSGSGEGGEHSSRYPGGELEAAQSKCKQIASGRFGVDAFYIMSVGDDGELNIKIGQGAKPGQGGHAPGIKIDESLGRQRGTVAGVDLISPPTQHDIYNIEDLMRLIWDIRAVHPKIKTVSVKVTTKAGVGSVAVGIAKCGADKIGLSGRSGGTGAAKSSAIRYTGGPLELGIFEAFKMLEKAGMVDKVLLEVDGGIITGADVVKLAIMGADEFGFGTSILQAGEGCILCKRCSDGTVAEEGAKKEEGCPVGICIRNPEAMAYLGLGAKAAKLLGKGANPMKYTEQLVECKNAIKHYLYEVAKDVQRILAKLGVRSLEECRGRTDLLQRVENGDRTDKVDLDWLWNKDADLGDLPDFGDLPIAPKKAVNEINQMMIDKVLAHGGGPFEMEIDMPGVADADTFDPEMSMRTIGGTLAGMIASGQVEVPDGGFNFKFNGYVGQTFGFCMVDGMRMELKGIGLDFVGEGMCGGKIIINPPSQFEGQAIPVAGASCAYGARGGKLHIAGKVGQRFGVRNSGADLVCEGTGKYAFEYMTGGRAVVLGETGYEVASGMSAGELFLWNGDGEVEDHLFKGVKKPAWMSDDEWAEKNQAVPMVVGMNDGDFVELHAMLTEYVADTNSLKGRLVLEGWENMKWKFAKVVPNTMPKPPRDSEKGVERRRQGGEFPMMVS